MKTTYTIEKEKHDSPCNCEYSDCSDRAEWFVDGLLACTNHAVKAFEIVFTGDREEEEQNEG
ncbi:MAG TPA: hypothetical protein ENH82_19380 [bacterium]|nr:hypothetical protein [bacterium]